MHDWPLTWAIAYGSAHTQELLNFCNYITKQLGTPCCYTYLNWEECSGESEMFASEIKEYIRM